MMETENGERQEKVLYRKKIHFSTRTIDIIISIVVFALIIFLAVFFNLKLLYILLILPVIYLIIRLWFRPIYIVTSRRFIFAKNKNDLSVLPVDAIEDIEFVGGKASSSKSDLILKTDKKFGDRLLITDTAEYGVFDLYSVPKPGLFSEMINKAKVELGSYISEE
jgi:ABC-type bacteriocin/lantibiotic exporter with double-glycine peptidase domain